MASRLGRRQALTGKGMRAAGEAEAQPSVQSTTKPEGQGGLCRRWPPLNTSPRNSPQASADGSARWESPYRWALCSQAASVHDQQLGDERREERAYCAHDWSAGAFLSF